MPGPSYPQYPDPNLFQSGSTREDKSTYDELIDGTSAPFAANSRYQAHIVDGLHRGPSLAGAKSPFASKLDPDASTETYPPKMIEKERDTRNLWQKVCFSLAFSFFSSFSFPKS